ncbi:MAG: serine hydrolase [Leucobacter sp.]|nr:serine hydrolase [Leucobacter sp.]
MALDPEMAARRSFNDLGLFTGAPQAENFANLKNLVPVREMPASSHPEPWPAGEPLELPATFDFAGETYDTAKYLADSETSALLVLQDGKLRAEHYWLTGGPDVQWISMSVAKSWVSAVVGIAVAEGAIRSIDDPISDYISVALGSAYEGVAIVDILRMSSGARWDEDYGNLESDAIRLARATSLPDGSLTEFVANMVRESEPGSVCRYNSADTQALGQLIINATGRDLASYMHEKLVEPLGFEQPAYWILDGQGLELAFAGVNMTARDFARIGELYRHGGDWHGRQVVPQEWVEASTRVATPVQAPGAVLIGSETLPIGYGYQWWLPTPGVFAAEGVYNQTVYVDPARRVTVVKLSATRKYGHADDTVSPLAGPLIAAIAASVD